MIPNISDLLKVTVFLLCILLLTKRKDVHIWSHDYVFVLIAPWMNSFYLAALDLSNFTNELKNRWNNVMLTLNFV